MMTTLWERSRDILGKLKYEPTFVPVRVAIPAANTDRERGAPFRPDRQYFQVRLNEMYLAYQRQWFKTFLPMAVVISEFWYDGQRQAMPFVVGPETFKADNKKVLDVPRQGRLLQDTRVAGLHPYRGGPLTLSVVLYQVQQDDYLRNMLGLVEKVTGVLDLATNVSSYLDLAWVILDGVESLFDSGQVQPVLGVRREFDPDDDDVFPGYYAMVNAPEAQLDPGHLWVQDNGLLRGPDRETAEPLRDADYVLYSVGQSDTRSDVQSLPLFEQQQRVMVEAAKDFESAKSNMLSLYQAMIVSPDLTETDVETLSDRWIAEMVKHRDVKRKITDLSGDDARKLDRLDEKRLKTRAILDLE